MRGTLFELVVGLGRYTPENLSGVPKGLLRGVRNIPKNVRVKAGLTVFRIARNADAKAGSSERQCPFNGGLV